jgi:Homeodomain-like domain
MSEREWKRADALARVAAGKLTTTEAAAVLELSVRHVRRLRRRVDGRGEPGCSAGTAGGHRRTRARPRPARGW